uniref:Uncharacterized protein n=1 Tax=Ixodes ricinus TaxID=34613 RepID=A0A6B0U953_IXORI
MAASCNTACTSDADDASPSALAGTCTPKASRDTVLLTALTTNVDNHSEPNARDICLMQTPRSISTIWLAVTPPVFFPRTARGRFPTC